MSDPRATCFPRWPTWEPDAEKEPEMMLAVKGAKAPETDYPVDPKDIPIRMQHFTDARGAFYVILYWPGDVKFQSGETKKSKWFSAKHYGDVATCKEVAYTYFMGRRRAGLPKRKSGSGPLRDEVDPRDGLWYHGGRNHTFVVWSSMKEFSAEVDHGVRMVHWNPYTETLDKPEEYCACCEPVCGVAPQAYRYRCLGHIHEEDVGLMFQDRDPRAGGGQERRDACLEAWRDRPIAVEDPFGDV